MTSRRLIVLGSTGSIGTQALEVVTHVNALAARGLSPARLEVVGLAAGSNEALLHEQAERFGVRELALCGNGNGESDRHGRQARATVRTGAGSAERLVRDVDCDVVLAAIVGVAGLPATLAAVQLGRDVALANKETLVAAGGVIVPEARRSGSRLLPVDSEHAGVWECLAGSDGETKRRSDEGTQARRHGGGQGAPPLVCGAEIARVILTASGGPFRTWTKEAIQRATPAQAMKHPTWSMGAKVTIDSASLMNKALELIEAHWLFGLCTDRLGVLVHPQSVIHAIVEHADGSCLAQMAAPDMRTPIQHALTWPGSLPGLARLIDWRTLGALEFEEPDLDRFPALGLGFEAIRRGLSAGAILNAANEEAVAAFVRADGAMPFGRVAEIVTDTFERVPLTPVKNLDDVLAADALARAAARSA